VDATRATLVALEKFLADEVANGRKPANLADAQKAIKELRGDLEAMSDELAAVRRDAVLARDEAGTGDEAAVRARALRAELRVALADEHRYMSRVVSRMKGRDLGKARQIALLTRTSNDITLQLDEVQTVVDEIVEVELAGVRTDLLAEKARLAAYKREFVTYEAESRELGGVILDVSFGEVKRKFYDVLVRSDIGVVDVAWSQKEAIDEAAQKLSLDRLRELRTLRDEFRDILEEDASQGGDQ